MAVLPRPSDVLCIGRARPRRMKVCLEPGCGRLQPESRCLEHRRARDRQRGTRQERGYDAAYDQAGDEYQRRMNEGERFDCWRCGRPLGTRRGRDWTLGHDDHDRSVLRGPECPRCQYATAGRADPPPDPHRPRG